MRTKRGVSLPEILLVLVLTGGLAAVIAPAARGAVEMFSLRRSASLARAHLVRARLAAVGRREVLSVQMGAEGELLLLRPTGVRLDVTRIQGQGLLRLDSVRLRPSRLRFNARGQGAAGRLSLYRGRREVRLVSNFLGRIRTERRSLP